MAFVSSSALYSSDKYLLPLLTSPILSNQLLKWSTGIFDTIWRPKSSFFIVSTTTTMTTAVLSNNTGDGGHRQRRLLALASDDDNGKSNDRGRFVYSGRAQR